MKELIAFLLGFMVGGMFHSCLIIKHYEKLKFIQKKNLITGCFNRLPKWLRNTFKYEMYAVIKDNEFKPLAMFKSLYSAKSFIKLNKIKNVSIYRAYIRSIYFEKHAIDNLEVDKLHFVGHPPKEE